MRASMSRLIRTASRVTCGSAVSLDGRYLTVELSSARGDLRRVGLQGDTGRVTWAAASATERTHGPTFQAQVPLAPVLDQSGHRFTLLADATDSKPVPVIHRLQEQQLAPMHAFAPHPETGQQVRLDRAPDGAVQVIAEPPRPLAVADRIQVFIDRIEISVRLLPEKRMARLMEMHPANENGRALEVRRDSHHPAFVIHPSLLGHVVEPTTYRVGVQVSGQSRMVGRGTSPISDLRLAYVYPALDGPCANGRRITMRARFGERGVLRIRVEPSGQESTS